MDPRGYFTVWTAEKAILYGAAVIFVAGVFLAVLLQPFLLLPCDKPESGLDYLNPSYVENPCQDDRRPALLFLTEDECIFGRRIIMSVFLGGLVGWERREADRPAGIRTMSLVSLGSCLFSITSAFAFMHGPLSWDASRVAAAIPSGVGFLGSALIFKQQEDGAHMVHGLTTAASVWLSAAVGIACSGGLFFVATFSCAVMLLVLRFGPRANFVEDDEEEDLTDNGPSSEHDDRLSNMNNLYGASAHEVASHRSLSEASLLLGKSITGSTRSIARQRPSITVE